MTDQTIIERAARAMDFDAWDALDNGHDLIKHQVRRAQTLRDAKVAIATLQSSAVLPSEAITPAMIEAALVSWDSSDGDDSGRMWNAIEAAMRAATPTAPVQDDDAELVEKLRRFAQTGRDRRYNVALNGYHADTFDRCADAIERLSRLSPTPETGLVEALTRLEKIVGITLDKDFGFWSSQGQSERRAELYPAWVQARRTLDALSNGSLSSKAAERKE